MSGLDDELDELISDLAAPYIPNVPATSKKEIENVKERKLQTENQNATHKQSTTISTGGAQLEITQTQVESEGSDEEVPNYNLMQLEEGIRRERELLEREIKLLEDKKKRQEELEIERQKIIQQRKEIEVIVEKKKLEQLKQEEKTLEEAKNNIQLREEKDHVRNVDIRKSVKVPPKKTKKEGEEGSSPPKSVVMIPQLEIKKPKPTPDKQSNDKRDKSRKDSVDETLPTYGSPTYRPCSTCGKQLMESAKFCAMCGTPTPPPLVSPRKKEKDKKEKKEKTGKDTSSSSDTEDKDRMQKMKVLEDIKAVDAHQRLRNSNERIYKPITESEEQQKEKEFVSAREEMLHEIQAQKKKNSGRKFSIWGMSSKEDKEKDKTDKHDKKSKDK